MKAKELKVGKIYKYDDGHDEQCDAKLIKIIDKEFHFIDSNDFKWVESIDDIPIVIKSESNVAF